MRSLLIHVDHEVAARTRRLRADPVGGGLARGFGRVYTPWFWRWIMLIVRLVPERLFIRTRL